MGSPPAAAKVVKARPGTKRYYAVSSIDNGFNMRVKGLKALGALLAIVAIEGTMVRVTVVPNSLKGGD